jgi:hypothetical protein
MPVKGRRAMSMVLSSSHHRSIEDARQSPRIAVTSTGTSQSRRDNAG